MKNIFFAVAVLAASTRASETNSEKSGAYIAVQDATNKFSLDLYRAMRSESGNLVVSPMSVAGVLALALQGAVGVTAQQISEALHLPSNRDTIGAGFRDILESFKRHDMIILQILNKLYVQSGTHIKDAFRKRAGDYFYAQAEEANFANDTENVRVAINQWVEKSTSGKIKNLFPEGVLGDQTRLVLVNAIYFKGGWLRPFEVSQTIKAPFFKMDSSTIQVEMMRGNLQLDYGVLKNLNAKAVSLPYTGKQNVQMIIILPESKNGLQKLEEGLHEFDLNNLTPDFGNVKISLPKFTIEAKHFLKEELKKIKINKLFGTDAELNELADGNIFVNDIIQNTFIQVNENGTEAAVATGINVQLIAQYETITFEANHPFLFILKKDDAILFIGRVTNPKYSGAN